MKRIQRVGTIAATAVLAFTSLLTIGFTAPALAAGANCIWIGAGSSASPAAGTDANFNNHANWSNCNSGAIPVAGDTIVFNPAYGSNEVSLTNNLGVSLGGVINTPGAFSTTATSFIIDTLSLAGGANLSLATTADCNQGPQGINITSLMAAGNVTVNTNGYNLYHSHVNVGGNLTLSNEGGNGYLTVANGSSVAGNIIVASPYEYQTNTACEFGGGAGANDGSSALSGFTVNGLTVQNGSSIQLNSSTFPISLGGGTGTGAPELFYAPSEDSNYNPIATTYAVSSPITLLSNAKIYAANQATVNVTGSITGTGFALTADSNSEGTINITPSSNTSSTQTGTQQNPVVTNTIASADSQPTMSETVVSNETLVLDGVRGSVNVNKNGTLKGTGSANSINISQGGTVAPGHSPGTLTAKNYIYLAPGAVYQAELKDAASGDYDQIIAGDATHTTGNDVTLGDNTGSPTLATILYSGYSIKTGDKFEIIDNLSKTAVKGTFAGLAEGATFTVNGYTFSISYKGGDGNDVVLTAAVVPVAAKTPNTGLADITGHPLVALFGSAAAAAALLVISRRLKPAHAKVTKR